MFVALLPLDLVDLFALDSILDALGPLPRIILGEWVVEPDPRARDIGQMAETAKRTP